MSVVPEICMQYTEVFRTVKIECVISLLIGLALGYYSSKLEK